MPGGASVAVSASVHARRSRSGVAGASVASGAGLQPRTIGSMALAWVLTLPAAMALAGGLYWLFLTLSGSVGGS